MVLYIGIGVAWAILYLKQFLGVEIDFNLSDDIILGTYLFVPIILTIASAISLRFPPIAIGTLWLNTLFWGFLGYGEVFEGCNIVPAPGSIIAVIIVTTLCFVHLLIVLFSKRDK